MLNLNNFQILDVENLPRTGLKLAIEKSTNIMVAMVHQPLFYLYNSPNIFNLEGIVRIFAAIQHNRYEYTVVTQYFPNDTILSPLKNYLSTNGTSNDKMNPTIRSKIIFGVATIMKGLHQNNIIHRKLLLNYTYLDNNLEPKIKLAPISTFINDTANFDDERYITRYPQMVAPELIEDENDPTFASDVYLYGIFLYKMFDNDIRFQGRDGPVVLQRIQQYMMHATSGHRYIRPNNVPDHYWELIERCLRLNPDERPTFAEIVEILKDDRFALNEFGMTTDLNDLHEYRQRIGDSVAQAGPDAAAATNDDDDDDELRRKIRNLESILPPKAQVDRVNQELKFIDEEEEQQFHQNLGQIGEGGISVTYKIKDTRTGKFLCKKVIKNRGEQYAFTDARNTIREFEALSKISHPCICKAIGINITEPVQVSADNENQQMTTIAVFLEFIEHKLASVLSNNNLAQNTLKAKIVVEIAHAMKFIHMNGMIHRDLKIENIMLNSALEVKLVDFGLIKMFENALDGYSFVRDSLSSGVGTIAYMSPEMLNEEDYDYKTDVYSFGVVLFFMFVGSLPRQHLRDIMSGNPIQMPIPSPSISQFCIDLISSCLSPSPSDRPSFEEILNRLRENSFNLASNIDLSMIERRDKELEYVEN